MSAQDQSMQIVAKLNELGVSCALENVVCGPTICRAEIVSTGKTTMRDFTRLARADDLAYEISAESIRIIAPVPGRSIVAVEFPRAERQTVTLEDLPAASLPLTVWAGLDVEGRPVYLGLNEMPHAIVAGATGSGKTQFLHSIIAQLVSVLTPDQVRLMLIDPKRVEFPSWEGLPHLVAPVADDPWKAIDQLSALITNMQDRYELLQKLGARNLAEGNEDLRAQGYDALPYIVCIVDELSELMMTSRKECESLLVRLLQKGRAAGIHLILATQYPAVSVCTGLIKSNSPTRIAFHVSSMSDSRVVLDQNGAEKLLGRGDGLLSFAGLPPIRFQSALETSDDISRTVSKWTAVTA